jgi:hypothetical protein
MWRVWGQDGKFIKGSGEEAKGQRPLSKPRGRIGDNIKTYLEEMGWDGMVWTGFSWLRIVASGCFFKKKVIKSRFINCGTLFYESLSCLCCVIEVRIIS